MRIASLVLVLTVVAILIFGTDAPAQSAAGGGQGAVTRVLDHFVVKGGVITWFVLIPLSVATVALALEHSLTIRRQTLLPAASQDRFEDLLRQKRYAEVLEASAADDSVLAYVVHNGLAEAANGFGAMERAIEEAIEQRTARLMRKIEYLNIIANVSPMIGLFGTVVGMIGLFATIGNLGNNVDADRIALNISIALVTTFWGLLIAIPALSMFALFRNRVEMLTAECALAAERMLSVFKPGEAGAEWSAARVRQPLGVQRTAVG
jgi:biopolymer transport protein ExbB